MACCAARTVEASTTAYVYDVNRSLPVLLDDGAFRYVWGLGLAYAVDNAGNAYVYYSDGLGSIRAVADITGTIVQTYRTDEFGVPTLTQGALSQPFQYTAEQRDSDTGLVYLRARMYEPGIGRFTSVTREAATSSLRRRSTGSRTSGTIRSARSTPAARTITL